MTCRDFWCAVVNAHDFQIPDSQPNPRLSTGLWDLRENRIPKSLKPWDCVEWPLHVVFDPAAHARECWMNMDHRTSLVTLQTHNVIPEGKKKLHKSQPRREHKRWPTSPWNQSQMPWTSMDTNGHQWTPMDTSGPRVTKSLNILTQKHSPKGASCFFFLASWLTENTLNYWLTPE